MIPHLERVELPQGMTVFETDETIKYVYFPNYAMISVVSSTESGQYAEAGVIGWEGIGGVEAVIGGDSSPNKHIIQLGGDGFRAPLPAARSEFERGGEFQRSILAFTRGLMAMMSQTALCNRLHVAEQRLAKWLLMCHDRSPEDTMNITQEFAALMLGANRVTLTAAAGQLQDHGLIEYKRGRIRILDRKALEAAACECYIRIRQEFNRNTG
jgi:CRP-like cAMP-binding protein